MDYRLRKQEAVAAGGAALRPVSRRSRFGGFAAAPGTGSNDKAWLTCSHEVAGGGAGASTRLHCAAEYFFIRKRIWPDGLAP